MERALRAFARQIKIPIETAFSELNAPANAKGELAEPALQSILAERSRGRRPGITIFVVQAIEGLRCRGGYIRGQEVGEAVVLSASGMRRQLVRVLPAARWWAVVILHELLHAVGLAARKGHAWRGCHCTAPWCNLYATVDWRSILCAALLCRLPMTLCRQCREDLEQPPPAGWDESPPAADRELGLLNALVALNGDNPRVYAMRADYLCQRQDPRAIPDLSRAIDLGHSRVAGCYFNRGQMYLLIGDPDRARADFEAGLRLRSGGELTPSHQEAIRATKFLDALALRREWARANNLEVNPELLTKIGVLEYDWQGFFGTLAETVDPATGRSVLLEEIAKAAKGPKGDPPESKLLAECMETAGLVQYLTAAPALDGAVDLRGYLFLARTLPTGPDRTVEHAASGRDSG
ncbi:MAG: hypothetical protein NTV86_19455 [Planctomycetota bacterium]|nr:hypothetical protein [Planctomycetota bacterium]